MQEMGRAGRPQTRFFPASVGRPGKATRLLQWPKEKAIKNYQNQPQGPPLLEDEEENPDAILLADMAPGQEGQDLRGQPYQVVGWEGGIRFGADGKAIPELLQVKSGDDYFLLRSDEKRTLLRDTVFYPRFRDEDLAAYALQIGFPESAEGGLWRMRSEGLWDMRVEDSGDTYIQIGPWLLTEKEDGTSEIREYPDAPAARSVIEHVAQSLETAPAIDAFLESYKQGTLPPERDATDRFRRITRLALLGLRDLDQTKEDLLQRSRSSSDPAAAVMLQVLAESLDRGPFPEREDPHFLRRVGPVWQMTSRLQIPE